VGREGREVKRGYFATLISGGPRVGTVSPVFDYTPGIALTRESFDEVPPRNVANKTTSSVITDITESPGKKPTGESGSYQFSDDSPVEVKCTVAAAPGDAVTMSRYNHVHPHGSAAAVANTYDIRVEEIGGGGAKLRLTTDSCGHVVNFEKNPA